MNSNEKNRKIIIKVTFFSFLALVVGTVLFIVSVNENVPRWLRIMLLVISALLILGSLIVSSLFDMSIGSFICPKCEKKFAPDMKEYVLGFNFSAKKKLKCPYCGNKGFCQKTYLNPDTPESNE